VKKIKENYHISYAVKTILVIISFVLILIIIDYLNLSSRFAWMLPQFGGFNRFLSYIEIVLLCFFSWISFKLSTEEHSPNIQTEVFRMGNYYVANSGKGKISIKFIKQVRLKLSVKEFSNWRPMLRKAEYEKIHDALELFSDERKEIANSLTSGISVEESPVWLVSTKLIASGLFGDYVYFTYTHVWINNFERVKNLKLLRYMEGCEDKSVFRRQIDFTDPNVKLILQEYEQNSQEVKANITDDWVLIDKTATKNK
jgi:hypothetical protein